MEAEAFPSFCFSFVNSESSPPKVYTGEGRRQLCYVKLGIHTSVHFQQQLNPTLRAALV
jgi:hypothetical protein